MNTKNRRQKNTICVSMDHHRFPINITFTIRNKHLNKWWKIWHFEVWFKSRRICDSNQFEQCQKWRFLKLIIRIIICTWIESNEVMIRIMFNFLSESFGSEWCSNFQLVSDLNQIPNHQNSNILTCDSSYSCENDKIEFHRLKKKIPTRIKWYNHEM